MTQPIDDGYDDFVSDETYEQSQRPVWEKRLYTPPDEAYTTMPPARRWLLRDLRNDRAGVLPLGKVGGLVAAGGAGKTQLCTQLAKAIATGQPFLGVYDTPVAGKVLLVLGEEDQEEVDRRIYKSHAVDTNIPPFGNLITLPLAGINCAFMNANNGETQWLSWLREFLIRTGPYLLVILDPLARFAPADAEKDNDKATQFVVTLESLIEPSGGATILGAHHTNQSSRQGKELDVTSLRGVTALGDAMRWVSALGVDKPIEVDGVMESLLTFSVVKTNYSRKSADLKLKFNGDGAIIPLAGTEIGDFEAAAKASDPKTQKEAKKQAKISEQEKRIDQEALQIIRDAGADGFRGTVDLRTAIAAKSHVGLVIAALTISRLKMAGCIREDDGQKIHRFFVIDGAPAPEHAAPEEQTKFNPLDHIKPIDTPKTANDILRDGV